LNRSSFTSSATTWHAPIQQSAHTKVVSLELAPTQRPPPYVLVTHQTSIRRPVRPSLDRLNYPSPGTIHRLKTAGSWWKWNQADCRSSDGNLFVPTPTRAWTPLLASRMLIYCRIPVRVLCFSAWIMMFDPPPPCN